MEDATRAKGGQLTSLATFASANCQGGEESSRGRCYVTYGPTNSTTREHLLHLLVLVYSRRRAGLSACFSASYSCACSSAKPQRSSDLLRSSSSIAWEAVGRFRQRQRSFKSCAALRGCFGSPRGTCRSFGASSSRCRLFRDQSHLFPSRRTPR